MAAVPDLMLTSQASRDFIAKSHEKQQATMKKKEDKNVFVKNQIKLKNRRDRLAAKCAANGSPLRPVPSQVGP